MPDGIRLRDAIPADLSVIADLIRALADYERLTHEIEWTEDELSATLFGPDAVPRVVLAEPTEPTGPPAQAVGFAVWFPTYSTFLGRPGIWLEDLFVLPDHRGTGVGLALLQHLFERAGDGRVEWAVLDWNEPSIAFYERQGARAVPGWTRYRWVRTPPRTGR
jgi:GNAT superfamily N-acetyltransferase